MPSQNRIWIIGASDGIGAALAREYAAEGAQLILSARSRQPLEDLANAIAGEHIVLPVDISDRAQLEDAAKEIAQIGPLDCIINMAAIYDPGSVAQVDPARAAQVITVNITGSFNVAQIAPPLLRLGGQLAMCGSVAGYFGLPNGQIYSATKAAVINLTETLYAELKGKVDVRLISPGFVDTRLTQRNDFKMPALVTPEIAAKEIVKGLRTRSFEIHFPRRFTVAVKLLRLLPYWAALRLTNKLSR